MRRTTELSKPMRAMGALEARESLKDCIKLTTPLLLRFHHLEVQRALLPLPPAFSYGHSFWDVFFGIREVRVVERR